ncbi:MAG: response regulator transcription factor [Chloroflexi bacterium]|nr:response regulator transcription factor [Chloroflexota bacterium]
MVNKKVLVVDDDVKIVELVSLYLKRDGYKIFTAYDGDEAIALAKANSPDIIVLDLMLPKKDGIEVCREIREFSDVPIIMLTAKITDEDKIAGLENGADDYMTKPFSPRELVARVRVILRRMPGERGVDKLVRGDIIIDALARKVTVASKDAKLTTIEFKILQVLATEPDRVFSRSELIERTMGYDFHGFDRTIDVHILNIRKKIEDNYKKPKYIQTIYGAGYKFTEH